MIVRLFQKRMKVNKNIWKIIIHNKIHVNNHNNNHNRNRNNNKKKYRVWKRLNSKIKKNKMN